MKFLAKVERLADDPRYSKLIVVAKNLHFVLLSCALLFVGAAWVTYLHEKLETIDDYIIYYDLISSKSSYAPGEKIYFYPFSETVVPVDVDVVEDSSCQVIATEEEWFAKNERSIDDFWKPLKFPEEIKTTLRALNRDRSDLNKKALRRYAEEEELFRPFPMRHELPPAGSVCYTTHAITVKTKIYGLEKTVELTSGPYFVRLN